MGSIIDNTKCPRCGNEEAHNEFYYKSGEEYIFCDKCGYNLSIELVRDENKNVQKNKNGEYKYKKTENSPYATYRIDTYRGFGSLGTLDSKEGVKDLKKYAKERAYNDGVSSIEVSRYDKDKEKIIKKKFKIPEGKRIITPDDPYGEENWES